MIKVRVALKGEHSILQNESWADVLNREVKQECHKFYVCEIGTILSVLFEKEFSFTSYADYVANISLTARKFFKDELGIKQPHSWNLSFEILNVAGVID